MIDQPASTPTTATPAADRGPVVDANFTPDQLRSMADHLVSTGKLTREQADAELRGDGAEPVATPTPEQAEYDQHFPRAKNISEYEMPRMGAEMDAKASAALDRTARHWLYEAGFDRGRGSSLLKEVNRVAQRTAAMSEVDRKLFASSERAKLARLWGNDTEAKITLGRQLVRELDAKHPGLVRLLEDSGAGNSAMVVSLLAAQAEILSKRPGRK